MRIIGFQVNLIKVLALLFCSNASARAFTLSGTITGKDSGTILLRYKNENNKICRDVATIEQGKFQFQGTVAGADYATLDTDTSYLQGDNTHARLLFIEPGKLHITFQYGAIGNAVITGSKVQAASDAWNQYKNKGIHEIKRITSAVDSVKGLLKEGKLDPQVAEQEMKALRKKAVPIRQTLIEQDLQYINRHPDSYVSVKLLNYLVAQVPNDSIDLLYAQLSDRVKNSSLGYGFLEYYARYKKAIGEEYPFDKIKLLEQAPSFTIYKTPTDSMTLDAYKGSALLLEFWELSCLPCLQANPILEKIRKKYSGDLKVIAINSASAKELPRLNTYIGKNQLSNWIHVSTNRELGKTNKAMLNGVFDAYYGLGVPRSIVVDKSGNIIYKHFGYAPEDIQALESAIYKAVNHTSE